MVTARVCAALMLEAAGVTVTVGVVSVLPTPLPPLLLPPPQASIEKTIAKRGKKRTWLAN
jgi:hypothetical protein